MPPRRTWIAIGLMVLAGSAGAQEHAGPSAPTADDLLRQQEQRIQELERRLDDIESSAMSGTVRPVDAPGPAELSGGTLSDEEDPFSGDIKETHQLMTGPELVSDDFPGSWPMFGSDMRMKLGGYIKTDFIADFDGTLDSSQFLVSTIPVEGTPEHANDGYVAFVAKETRFNLDIRDVTPDAVPLRGFIEGDFFDPESRFRLRHAYITAGNFIIGQTWTTLSFLESLPVTIDFAAGDALFGGRASQVRYQAPLGDAWNLSVALEELPFLGIENTNGLPGQATTQLPLLAFRADYRWDSGLFLLGTSIAQLHWDGGATGPSDSALQYAFVVGGRQNVSHAGYLTWNVSYGEGSGENIMAFAGSDANAVLNASGELETFPALAFVLGSGYDWTQTLSSNLSYAYGWLETPDSRAPLSLKSGGIGHVNLILKHTEQFSTGAEFMWGTSKAQNGATGDAQRLQLMAKFEF